MDEPEISEIQETQAGANSSSIAANPRGHIQDVQNLDNPLSPVERAIEQEVFALEMGYGLLVLADKKKGGDLLDRITGARTNFAKEMGMLLPTIGVRDSIELEPNEYRFLLRGKEIERSSVIPDRFMAMNMGDGDISKLGGIPCVEPVFGIQASWVPEDKKRNAEVEGCTVVDPSSVLVTHLSDVLKKNAHLILEREGTRKAIDRQESHISQ